MYKWKYEYFNSDYFKATQKKRSRIYYIIFYLLAVACLFIEFTLFASPEPVNAFTQDGYVQRSYVIDTPADFLTSTNYFYTPNNQLLSSSTNPLYYINSDYDIQYTRTFVQSVGQWFSYFKCVPTSDEVPNSSNTYLKFRLPASSLPTGFNGDLTLSISFFNSENHTSVTNVNRAPFWNCFEVTQYYNNGAEVLYSSWFNSTTPLYNTYTFSPYRGGDIEIEIMFATDIYLGNIKLEQGSFSGFVNDTYLPNGYNQGYQDGWYEGYNSVNSQGLTFLGFMNAVIGSPLNAVLQIFDVEILGYNMKALLASLLSISLVLLIIKFILGHVGGDSD